MSHNFSFKTKLPNGVLAGVTPVGETRLLATVQMQLDEVLTLALTFFFLNTHTFFPPAFLEDPPPAVPLIRRLLVGGGTLNVIGPMR